MPSTNPVILCEELAKTYAHSIRPVKQVVDALREGWTGHSNNGEVHPNCTHALLPLNLAIAPGEAVGIVGRNGSGKSTLLQLICGVLRPSAGSVVKEGKVAALLELGSGFDPDFTGRENVYFAASLLGFSEAEIDTAYPKIEDFASIGGFIERPVRCYSSGMKLRLAFAVYTMVQPDILIIDEALAVGDEGFQRKCYRRLETLREEGATLLFVSHSPAAVIQLCDRVLWFEGGRLIADGPPKPVMDAYHRFTHLPPQQREPFIEAYGSKELPDGQVFNESPSSVANTEAGIPSLDPTLLPHSQDQYPTRGCEILNFRILDENGRVVNVLQRNQRYRFVYEVHFSDHCEGVFFAMFIKSLNGTELGGMTEPSLSSRIPKIPAGKIYEVEFSFQCLLAYGVYFINSGVEKLESDESVFAHRIIDAVMFRVNPSHDSATTGMLDFQIAPELREMSSDV